MDAKKLPSAMCRLVIGWRWVEHVLMGCWAQNSKPGLQTCPMADGAPLPNLLLCWPFHQENYGYAVMAFYQ
jgi:hypothetical protein